MLLLGTPHVPPSHVIELLLFILRHRAFFCCCNSLVITAAGVRVRKLDLPHLELLMSNAVVIRMQYVLNDMLEVVKPAPEVANPGPEERVVEIAQFEELVHTAPTLLHWAIEARDPLNTFLSHPLLFQRG